MTQFGQFTTLVTPSQWLRIRPKTDERMKVIMQIKLSRIQVEKFFVDPLPHRTWRPLQREVGRLRLPGECENLLPAAVETSTLQAAGVLRGSVPAVCVVVEKRVLGARRAAGILAQ